MKNQVTSIEQSRRLMELGVPAEKAIMVWTSCSNEWHISVFPHYRASKESIDSGVSIPAFTVADLLEMMPEFIGENKPLFIERRSVDCSGSKWCVGYRDRVTLWIDSESSLLDVCILGIEWLLSNGYKLES